MAVFEFNSMAKGALRSSGRANGETGVLDWADSEGKQRSCEIVIDERAPRGLVAKSRTAPPRNQMMRLREPNSTYYVVVQSVSGSPGDHTLDLIYSYAGRRQEQRQHVSGPAEVSWTLPGRVAIKRCAARVSDVSPEGLRLASAEALPVGVEVKISGSTLECIGRTVYCKETDSDYQVGVHFSRDPREGL